MVRRLHDERVTTSTFVGPTCVRDLVPSSGLARMGRQEKDEIREHHSTLNTLNTPVNMWNSGSLSSISGGYNNID